MAAQYKLIHPSILIPKADSDLLAISLSLFYFNFAPYSKTHCTPVQHSDMGDSLGGTLPPEVSME